MGGIQNRISNNNSFYPNSFVNNINTNNIKIEGYKSIFLSNNANKRVYNFKGERKKFRHFAGRNGDWICPNCQNLNFAFRIICNRCHIPKNENEKNKNVDSTNNNNEINETVININEKKKKN